MKKIKWKILIITGLLCLAPILLGIAVYDKMPAQMAIHFNINNTPDRFAPKNIALFLIPVLMLLLQIFCCVISDINAAKKGDSKKFETAIKLIIPIITFIIYTATISYTLDSGTDIRRITMFILGFTFVVIGNYLPKVGYVNKAGFKKLVGDKARKLNRIMGYEMVGLGILFFISILLPPFASVAVLILLFPYIVINCIYAVYLRKNG